MLVQEILDTKQTAKQKTKIIRRISMACGILPVIKLAHLLSLAHFMLFRIMQTENM